ncbi:LOW QUALITY PROTEIN: desmoglein-2-like [Etheostoma spectabile]|uniref:LOW QUALITY PROTEIN: desmoglein-2-like n=1 Tax=Etheostoma spectabile TaxID=54343 RepID=UPI0013AFB906|nr:LOW QUALITY PROTEIN: desmoglein-2-like [Etheostoma spectabile]
MLLFCNCGGAGGLPDGFTEMPFDTKSHLINYRTEGQGENTEVPLLNMPTQMDGNMVNMNMGMINNTSAMAGLDFQRSVTSMDGMNGAVYQDGFVSGLREGSRGMAQQSGSGFYSEFEGRESGAGREMYDGMALPDHFLAQYYTQKVASGNDNLGGKDCLLVYDYEGQGSPAGSVGCCSLLESDNDLQFLDDLGTKFKTLAEVCGGKKIPTEVKQEFTPLPSASVNTQTSVSSLKAVAQQLPPPPKPQPSPPKAMVSETVKKSTTTVKEGKTTVTEGMTTVKEGMATQGQMVLLQQPQQPVYYTTAPVMQPMHYVVQPQVQNTVLLAEAPATNMQNMVLVNGPIWSGPRHTSPGPQMMLVERSGVQGSGANMIRAGNLSGSQTMMVMEGMVPVGSMKHLSGSQTYLVQQGAICSSQEDILDRRGSCWSGGQRAAQVSWSRRQEVYPRKGKSLALRESSTAALWLALKAA